MNQQRAALLFFVTFFFLFAPGRVFCAESCLSKGWPHERTDLTPDPALTFGTLKNGIRYVIMPNREPKGRVSLQLDIQSGSLHETEAQRGLAHFLEHMMFNGTTHYPPGKMVDYFQSIGMAFGPDTNAHTSYGETVYQLMLPDSGQKTLSDGLQLLADYAGGALLLPEEVNKERGVILAEKRERDSAGIRVYKASLEQAFAGTLIARRFVIGEDKVLQTADAALLRQYYERWYRPDNMIVVAVGDAEPALLKELISSHFSPLKARTEEAVCPDLGKVAEDGTEAFYQHEPDLGHTQVSIASVWNEEPEPFTQAAVMRQIREYAAILMMSNRLLRLKNQKDSPFADTNFYSYKMARRFGITWLKARTAAENWREGLKVLNTALRQALRDGFSESELKRAKSEILTLLREQVQSAASRKSDDLAAAIIGNLNEEEVTLSPEQEMAMLSPAVEKMTLAEAEAAFRSLWHERRLVKIAGTADLQGETQPPEAAVLAAFQTAEAADLKPWEKEKESVFPYLPPPAAEAAVTQRITYGKIGAERCLFSNGLVLNLKKTNFEPNNIQIAAAFGSGELSQPKPGLALLAQMLLPESGLGGLDQDQLREALAPYASRVHFMVADDSFQFRGEGLKSETELLFQLLRSHLDDPAFREEAFARVIRKVEQMYAQLGSSVEGAMNLKGEQFLAGGNPRYGMVPLEELKKLTLADVQGWLAPVLKNEGLEISVVGDFDPEQVIRLTGRYFGGRRGKLADQPKGGQIVFPSGKKLNLEVATDSDKAQITVAWPTDDFWDIARTRRLNVLAAVLDDRLRKQIREDLGAAYSPYVYNHSSTVDPGYGVLRSVLVAAPSQAAMLAGKLKQVGAQLAKGKVSEEELRRALEPNLTLIRDLVRTNRYWLDSVLVGSTRHPQRLEWPERIQQDYASVKREEIAALAAKYLLADRAAEVIAISKKNQGAEQLQP
jgi:zinc protease